MALAPAFAPEQWIDAYPELAAQWHPTKNGSLRPRDLTYGSGRKVWWKCPAGPGHEWEASPNNRTSGRSGCPYCAGRLASAENNLALLYPELCEQWHPSRNEGVSPEETVPGSARRVWWQCSVAPEHEWQAAPCDRIEGKGGCPFCLGMRILPQHSLAVTFPSVASEWHKAKNGRLTPWDVTSTTTRVVWWQCGRDPAHQWRASIQKQSSAPMCPLCAADATANGVVSEAARYVLVLQSELDARLALSLFLRSRGIEALGARDGVEATRLVEERGSPTLVLMGEGLEAAADSALRDLPRRVIPASALRTWLAAQEGAAESLPPILREVAELAARTGPARRR